MSIQRGDRVRVGYTGRFEGGSVFATSDPEMAGEHGLLDAQDREPGEFEPLTFTVGRGEVIEGLEAAVVGMTPGEQSTVTVPPEHAYGDRDPDLVREYDADTFRGMVGQSPTVGLHVEAHNDRHGDVVAVTDETVTVDFNHELAGKTLVFDLEVLTVE